MGNRYFGDSAARLTISLVILGLGTTASCGGGNPRDSSCQSDTDCGAQEVCGPNNGPAFGLLEAQSACWPAYCPDYPNLSECTNIPTRCQSDADCTEHTVCGLTNGKYFGLGASRICWPAVCEHDRKAGGCGSLRAPCGACGCTPDCSGAKCGSASDGCGGSCDGVCADGEPGCTTHSDCQLGSSCWLSVGTQFGYPPHTDVCVPDSCLTSDWLSLDCGTEDSPCGTCPPCEPECDGCETGPDGCGGQCESNCDFSSAPPGAATGCFQGQCSVILP